MVYFIKKYHKGFSVGLITSAIILLLLAVSCVSAAYGMDLKAKELSEKSQIRDNLINNKTEWIFAEYKVRHEDAQYLTYNDVVNDINEIMDKYY